MKPTTPKRGTYRVWRGKTGTSTIADLPAVEGDDGAQYSCWIPTAEEKLRIFFGAPIVIGILTDVHPPITVKVGEESIFLRTTLDNL